MRPGFVALALVLTIAPALVAQQTAEDLRARLDSLRPIRAAAAEALRDRDRRDQLAAAASAAAIATVDTFRVGLVTVVTPVEQTEIARALFTEVWEESFGFVTRSPSLDEAMFSFQWSETEVPIFIEAHGRPITRDSKWTRRPTVKQAIRDGIAATLNYDLSRLGTEVGMWVSGNPLLSREPGDIYRAVAVTRSIATRACLDGDVGACRSAFDVDRTRLDRWWLDSDGTRKVAAIAAWEAQQVELLESWYTPEERRLLVAERLRYLYGRTRATAPAWGLCVEQGDFDTCDRLLVQTWTDHAPLPGSVRESLLAFAIEQGGDGAWDRLTEDPSMPAGPALEYASAMPLDALVAGWRELVVSSRPRTFGDLLPRSGLTLMWIVFFAALAMRSTRWRLG